MILTFLSVKTFSGRNNAPTVEVSQFSAKSMDSDRTLVPVFFEFCLLFELGTPQKPEEKNQEFYGEKFQVCVEGVLRFLRIEYQNNFEILAINYIILFEFFFNIFFF